MNRRTNVARLQVATPSGRPSATVCGRTAMLVGSCERLEQRRHMSVATWDGGSAADANWSTPANWLGDVAPAPADDLVFPAGAARGNANNDYAAATSFNSISFLEGGYTI